MHHYYIIVNSDVANGHLQTCQTWLLSCYQRKPYIYIYTYNLHSINSLLGAASCSVGRTFAYETQGK